MRAELLNRIMNPNLFIVAFELQGESSSRNDTSGLAGAWERVGP